MSQSSERVLIVDFARGLAALLLVVIHSLWMFGTHETQFEAPLGSIVHTLGQMTAAFLITMGFSFVVTRHQSIAYGLKRALLILLAGYLLNTLKFIVPISVFGTMPENFIEAYGWSSPLTTGQLRYLFLTGDILQLAGISFFIITFVRHYIKNKWIVLALTVASVFVSSVMKGYHSGIAGLDYVFDLLWGKEWNVYFPVFPWISNILAGMFGAMWFKEKGGTEEALEDVCLKVSLGMLAVGLPLCFYDWKYHFNDFFHTGPGGALYLIGINLLVFWVLSKFVFKYLKHKQGFVNGLRYLSKQVTSIYIIQWVLVCWLMGIIGYKTLNTVQLLMLFPFMIAACLVIDYLIKRLKETLMTKASG